MAKLITCFIKRQVLIIKDYKIMKITRSSSPENFTATKSRKSIELFEDYVEAINEINLKKVREKCRSL